MKYLVTGAAGFIGSQVVRRLCQNGHQVTGVDNLNDYYDVSLKRARLKQIRHPEFTPISLDISNHQAMNQLFTQNHFDRVIHLAAQAGVRYSLQNPMVYGESNLLGFLSVLECCRHHRIEHLVYASSSSVYGLNHQIPFSIHDKTDHPASLYAATKKSNELMAHSYSHLYDLPTTGLRFFTVYGPWGRPDMALFKFTRAITEGKPIQIFNHGNMFRDFTYIDDVAEAVIRIQDHLPVRTQNHTDSTTAANPGHAPCRIFNVGHGSPVSLMEMIETLEQVLGLPAIKELLPMQPGDVYQTYADTRELFEAINFKPQISLSEGIRRFVGWYQQFYGVCSAVTN